MLNLNQFITNEQIAALKRPTASATGLPGAAYADNDFWELERRDYFPSRWMACAHESDLPNSGDVIPVTVGGYQLILTRSQDNIVRAFHNICAHRGMRVLQSKQCGQHTISCPWHGWTYDLQGQLVATPNLGGINVSEVDEFEKPKLGLHEVRCDTYLNAVFVNLDNSASTLADFLAPLSRRLARYDLSDVKPDGKISSALFEGNWKLVIEGGIEDYHLPWIHPQLGKHSGSFTAEWDESNCYVGFSSRRPAPESTAEKGNPRQAGSELPEIRQLEANPFGDRLAEDFSIFMVPPSAVFAIMPNHVVTTLLLPKAVDRTEQRRSFLFAGEAAQSEVLSAARKSVSDSWVYLGEQDLGLARALQNQHALRTNIDIPTRFSPHWEPAVHHFQKMIVDHLQAQQST